MWWNREMTIDINASVFGWVVVKFHDNLSNDRLRFMIAFSCDHFSYDFFPFKKWIVQSKRKSKPHARRSICHFLPLKFWFLTFMLKSSISFFVKLIYAVLMLHILMLAHKWSQSLLKTSLLRFLPEPLRPTF